MWNKIKSFFKKISSVIAKPFTWVSDKCSHVAKVVDDKANSTENMFVKIALTIVDAIGTFVIMLPVTIVVMALVVAPAQFAISFYEYSIKARFASKDTSSTEETK